VEKELLYMLLWLSYKRTMNYNNSSIIRKHTRSVLKKREVLLFILINTDCHKGFPCCILLRKREHIANMECSKW
jgi:hypothetical protein